MASVGERLDARLKEVGMSIPALAEAIGMSENNIYLLIREPGRGLHSANAAKIAQVLGVTERWLVMGYLPKLVTDKPLREDESELLNHYREMSPEMQATLVRVARGMREDK